MPIREIVSQISPPMRILLAGAVVFLAVWFTLLRPKADSVAPATTTTAPTGNVNTGQPATSAPGKLVEKAKTAATQAEGAAKAAAGETATTAPATQSGSATATKPQAKADALPTIPAATLAKLPKDVASALAGHKVVVLGVVNDASKPWRPMADDDRYVRNTLTKVNRYDGQVLVKTVSLANLYTYAPLISALKVNQTPTVVVVDRKLTASVVPGYVDRLSINQAIADARDASVDPLIADPFLRKANQVCAQGNVSFSRWSQPTIPGKTARLAAGKRLQVSMRAYRRAVGKLAAPAKWRGLKRQWLAELAGEQKIVDTAAASAKGSANDVAVWNAVIASWDATDARKLDGRFNEAGLTACAVNRQL